MVNVRIPRDLLERVDQEAARVGEKRAATFRRLLRKALQVTAVLGVAILGISLTAARAQAPPLPTPLGLYPHIQSVSGPQFLFSGQPGNVGGFEGGHAWKDANGTYWIATTELIAGNWVKTQLGLWSSTDGWTYHRQATLVGPSSGDQSGNDRRAAIWAPEPVLDPDDNTYRLFYVTYRSKLGNPDYDGEVWEAKSTVPGLGGVTGPYAGDTVILDQQGTGGPVRPWEGAQGRDSISNPVWNGDEWVALYGSHGSAPVWSVGLVTAPSLDGPWTVSTAPALGISPFLENPQVTPVETATGTVYLAMFDDVSQAGHLGCMWSGDMLHWSTCDSEITATPWPNGWDRTPLGLIEEWDGSFTLVYTTDNRYATSHDMYKIWVK